MIFIVRKLESLGMKIRFKKMHPDAVIPVRAHEDDAGLDLTAVSVEFSNVHQFFEYDTGIAVEIPPGYVGLAVSRSSVSKTGLSLCNGVGVIDSSYRGSIKARFYKEVLPGMRSTPYVVGDKVLQLLIVPIELPTPIESEELSSTDRGSGGFGSTGL